LIFKGILFGDLSNHVTQAEALNGFMDAYLSAGGIDGGTIVFYLKDESKKVLMNLVPTASATFVRVASYRPETILKALQTVEKTERAHLYVFPGGFAGSEIAVRWACRIKGSSLTQVKQIEYAAAQLIAKKSVYVNHLMGTFRLTRKPFCISLAKDGVNPHAVTVRDTLAVAEYDLSDLQDDGTITRSKRIPAEVFTDIEAATFLIIGGRGMHNEENTRNLKKIAHDMGAEFGVSRPVAMSAWAPMQRMIGVSGVMTKPEICIAAGVSGAPAFYAGIEKSKRIIAINTDPRAPIMKACDVAVLDDYKSVMAALAEIVSKDRFKR
jgi:electron transfer flavoprotein alpha subunit